MPCTQTQEAPTRVNLARRFRVPSRAMRLVSTSLVAYARSRPVVSGGAINAKVHSCGTVAPKRLRRRSASSVCNEFETRQPTMNRLKTSMTNATYTKPVQVLT
jgi:hypothetical protein